MGINWILVSLLVSLERWVRYSLKSLQTIITVFLIEWWQFYKKKLKKVQGTLLTILYPPPFPVDHITCSLFLKFQVKLFLNDVSKNLFSIQFLSSRISWQIYTPSLIWEIGDQIQTGGNGFLKNENISLYFTYEKTRRGIVVQNFKKISDRISFHRRPLPLPLVIRLNIFKIQGHFRKISLSLFLLFCMILSQIGF